MTVEARDGGVMDFVGQNAELNQLPFNHDAEAKNGVKVDPTKPKGDYGLDANGWLVVNGKSLRRTRFAKDWK